MTDLWSGFPDMGFDAAKERTESGGSDERCTRCLGSTARAVEQLRADIDSVRREMLRRCYD
jgi:hypothetical protein